MAEQDINIKSEAQIINYRLGRFSVNIPSSVEQKNLVNKVYFTDISDFLWDKEKEHNTERKITWDSHIESVKKLNPPRGIDNIIIETRDFSAEGYWAKGVFYHGNDASKIYAGWDVLFDNGQYGAWLKVHGTADRKKMMIDIITTLLKSYRSPDKFAAGKSMSGYFLKKGYIDIGFKDQEKTYARFEGHPLDPYLKVEIEMEAVEEVEESNLIERLSASLVGNFAPGLSIDKLRSDTRKVAGFTGDEIVIRGTEDGSSKLSFSWRFPGKKDSAVAPEILITMETKDGDLEDKLELWDSILNSFKPLGH